MTALHEAHSERSVNLFWLINFVTVVPAYLLVCFMVLGSQDTKTTEFNAGPLVACF